MSQLRIALFAAVPLLCASLAAAQAPAGAPEHRHPDMAAMHKAMCGDHQAAQAARLAFVEAKLELTDAQKPLFAKWRQIVLDNAAKAKASCLSATPKPDAKPDIWPTIIDREAHAEMLLAARLEAMKASRPALQALYENLTPAQRQVLDHPRHRGGWNQHGGMHEGMRGHDEATPMQH
jgi:hypothetical protein